MHILKYKTNNIYFEPRLKNRTSAFPSYRRSNSNYLADQTPFILLKNLRKNNGKFRYLLRNVIAEKLFLIYAYKTMVISPNYIIHLDFINKSLTQKINIK